jgi:hypothetical protein
MAPAILRPGEGGLAGAELRGIRVAKKKKISYLGWGIAAALIGAGIAFAIIHKPEGTPIPYVKDSDAYDDNWGKLDEMVPRATVKHILISWKDKNARVMPKDPNRTQEQARKLIEDLWKRYKADPTDANWKGLQAEYNEDTEPHSEYVCEENPRPDKKLDDEFTKVGRSTKVNHARITNFDGDGGAFGYHLIRREK